jgi:ferric-chelate reductase
VIHAYIGGMASVLTYVSFFVTICYHTPFTRPWIYPPLALYGLDLLMRLFRFRVKDASLTPMEDMTIVGAQILSSWSPR